MKEGEAHYLRLPREDVDYVVDAVGALWENVRGQRLLLTGGTGFIGKWLLSVLLTANRLYGLGVHITVISRSPSAFLQQFPDLLDAKEIEWICSDLRDLCLDQVPSCTHAIHAALDVAVASQPKEMLETCILGTQKVLDAMAASGPGLRRVLILSSGAVYGRIPQEIFKVQESWTGAPDLHDPMSAYGEGKRVSELLGAMAAACNPGLEVTIARCFAFVGPYLPLDKHFAIGNFIDAATNNRDIVVQGDGTPIRSYLYAADLARWLWTMLFSGPSGRTYNVGGDEAISIGELAPRVNRVLGGKGRVHIVQKARLNHVPQTYVPSLTRIKDELMLEPTHSLDEAIEKTAKWAMREQETKKCRAASV